MRRVRIDDEAVGNLCLCGFPMFCFGCGSILVLKRDDFLCLSMLYNAIMLYYADKKESFGTKVMKAYFRDK